MIPRVVLTRRGGPRIKQDVHVSRDKATGNYTFQVLPRMRRNRHIDSQLDAMRGNLERGEMSMPYPDGESARLGALSWGYLALFAFLGYSFVLQPSLGMVRRVLLQASTEHLGLGTLIGRRSLPSPFDAPVPVVLIRDVGSAANEVVPAPFAVGARMGGHVAVFPLADDASAHVYDELDAAFSPGGTLGIKFADLTWHQAFGRAADRAWLRDGASWTWTAGPTEVKLVRRDVARARAVLAAPLTVGKLPTAPQPDDWRGTVRELPADVPQAEWPTAIADSLATAGLVPKSASETVVAALERASVSGDASVAGAILAEALDPVAASHALDAFRIFLLGEDARTFDQVPPDAAHDVFAAMVRRVTNQRVVGGHIDQRLRDGTSIASALLVWPQGYAVVGEHYTRHTLLMAATASVQRCVSEGV